MTRDAEDALRRLLDDEDTAVIDAAAEALVRRADSTAAALLCVAVRNSDAEVGEHVLWVLEGARQDGSAPVVELCTRALTESNDHAARCGAAEALGWLGAVDARPALRHVVETADGEAATAAAEALAELDRRADQEGR